MNECNALFVHSGSQARVTRYRLGLTKDVRSTYACEHVAQLQVSILANCCLWADI